MDGRGTTNENDQIRLTHHSTVPARKAAQVREFKRQPATNAMVPFGKALNTFLSAVTNLVSSLIANAMNSQSYAEQSLSRTSSRG